MDGQNRWTGVIDEVRLSNTALAEEELLFHQSGAPPTAAAPVISPADAFQMDPVDVSIATATPGATIRFTTDGSIPDETSTVFTAPLRLSTNTMRRMEFPRGAASSCAGRLEFPRGAALSWHHANLPARNGTQHLQAGGMAKSSALSYHPPFRYRRPADDLQAVFGAQTGNPPIVTAENKPAPKRPAPAKKRPSATAAKSSKAPASKTAKPAAPKTATSTKAKATAKPKAKKPARKR